MEPALLFALLLASAKPAPAPTELLALPSADGLRQVRVASAEESPEEAAVPENELADAIATLAAEAPTRSPGSDLSLAVYDLVTSQRVSIRGEEAHVSASAAKPIWVAAALRGASVDAVAPHAEAVFRDSDNLATGSVIDLVGAEAVEAFYGEAGMDSSAFTQWNFGAARMAASSPRRMGTDNYFTADDGVAFLAALDRGALLPAESTSALEAWMLLSPRTGVGGWLGTLLPEAVRGSILHKAGWLPPGTTSDDASYRTMNELGIVTPPAPSHRYAISILARRGSDYWGAQAALVEHSSCVVYKAMARDTTLDCR